jgi:hypothetical protein
MLWVSLNRVSVVYVCTAMILCSLQIIVSVLCISTDQFCSAGGYILSAFCSSDSLVVDVTDTDIFCYSGCLTSSKVQIVGASSNCHGIRISGDCHI